MGYVNYANYSNGYIGVRDDLKRWPLDLPYSSSYFNTDDSVRTDISLSGEVLKTLRQHVKAIKAQFLFGGSPTYAHVSDAEVASGQLVENENLNEVNGAINASYAGLLDEMSEIGINPGSAVANGRIITASKINDIVSRLNNAAQYNNYSNYTNNTGPYYLNGYQNHTDSYSSNTRSIICHTNHKDYSQSGSNYLDVKVSYANYSYSNSITSPATYQNSL